MPRNPGVRLDPRRRHPIVVSPLEAQPEPEGLGAIKAELGRRWPMTGLLDVLKESDLRVGFTAAFATAAARETTRRVVNATLAARNPRVWGESTTACASDS